MWTAQPSPVDVVVKAHKHAVHDESQRSSKAMRTASITTSTARKVILIAVNWGVLMQ